MAATKRQRMIAFAGALIVGFVSTVTESHAAGVTGVPVIPPPHTNAIYLGYPSIVPVIHHPPVSRWSPFGAIVYRIIHPHIIIVTAAGTLSDRIVMTGDLREEWIAFPTTPADAGQNHAVIVTRGTTISVVPLP